MYCPNCKQEFPGKFCPECGAKLVELPKQNDLGINISDDAAIMGGVNVTRNESHNTTSYDHRVITTQNVTNIVERQKSDAEIRNERNIQFMELCKAVFKDGLLAEEEKVKLVTERIRLGIDETEAARLIEMARKSSMSRMTTLGMRDSMTLKTIDRYIESNNVQVLCGQIPRLEALARNYKVDEVLYRYYMLLAALQPEKLILEYETNAADEYWKTYWVAIAYMKRGDAMNAEDAIVKLDFYPEYSEDNSLLLSAVSTYGEFGADAASEYICAILPEHCSSLLMPFIHALFLEVSPERAAEIGADKDKCQLYID
ncbi:MAG: zinc ribbon domain-containing protein, partial [Bacteroidaceae bacterium]|nr:zinc ribbon domain-containing protein [Bacteroidaceae bacterium]